MASAAIQIALVVKSVIDTQPESVLPPPEPPVAPDVALPTALDGAPAVRVPDRTPVWSIVLLVLAAQIVLFVFIASIWPVRRYETAPGTAEEVVPRVAIQDAPVFDPTTGPLFVTATSSELTGLQALMGWFDDTVDVRTCEQQFGTCNPDEQRQVSLGAMATTKQIAEYVAMSRLGIEAQFDAGPVQIGSFSADTCPAEPPPMRACAVLGVGDTLTEIDGQKVSTLADLDGIFDDRRPGDVIDVTATDMDGNTKTVQVELMASPDDPERTIMGFMPRDTRTVQVPITVDIDTDRIGGPSAGLSFTLGLIDMLTEGDLMPPDDRVAVTGTIDEDGNVGAIGALPQKAEAVRRAGATLFLVPEGQSDAEVARAQEIAGDGVEIVKVATLEEALTLLAERGGDPIPPAPTATSD